MSLAMSLAMSDVPERCIPVKQTIKGIAPFSLVKTASIS